MKRVAAKPVPRVRLAGLLISKGEDERAREVCARAFPMAPGNCAVCALAAKVPSHEVPTWYRRLLQNRARHQIYEAAFRARYGPAVACCTSARGSACSRMMAARAGAA